MEHKISVFQKEEWKKFLPEKLHIVTKNGNFHLVKSDVVVMPDKLELTYYQRTFTNPNDATKDGEPDTLSFDIHMVKTNDGSEANPNTLKLDVDIAYGDAMVSEFTITKPGQIEVLQYTGFGSLYDKSAEFAFEDNSIKDLIIFFNRFGFDLNREDFCFLDKNPTSYVPECSPEYESVSFKYIKTFERFNESVDNFDDFVKDELVSLLDNDFYIYTKKPSNHFESTYTIYIEKNIKFSWKDIDEDMSQFLELLNSKYKLISIYIKTTKGFTVLKTYDEMISKSNNLKNITKIVIEVKK